MHDRVGGEEFFEQLTLRFYQGVAADPLLSALYPSDAEALEASRVWLRRFLVQYWGGPADYSATRGHPRLRMRHAPFVIGPAERDAWVHHMTVAVRQGCLAQMDEMQMRGYFTSAATAMINAGS